MATFNFNYDLGAKRKRQELERRLSQLDFSIGQMGQNPAMIAPFPNQPIFNTQQEQVLRGLLPLAPDLVGQQLLGATFREPEKPLSVEEALKLGVPFGTSPSQAAAMNITPRPEETLSPQALLHRDFLEGKVPLDVYLKNAYPAPDQTLTPIYDPTSPSGIRYSPRMDAAGKPAPIPTPLVTMNQPDPRSIPYGLTDLERLMDPRTGKSPGYATPADVDSGRFIVREKPIPAETAGKQSMIETAISELPTIEKNLFAGGVPNRGLITEMWALSKAPAAASLLSSEAGQLAAAYELGVQAITRTETGANMPPEEVQNTANRFKPKPWDSDETIQLKWRAYNLFLSNVSKYLDPNSADKTFEAAVRDAKTKNIPMLSPQPPEGFRKK